MESSGSEPLASVEAAARLASTEPYPLVSSHEGAADTIADKCSSCMLPMSLVCNTCCAARTRVAWLVVLSAGCPIGDVAKYLGDSEQVVVKTYLHPTGRDPAETMDEIFRKVSG